MKRLTVTYSIVTPMFLGDASQKCTGFRVPSLKGALRFWWRALVWSKIQREHQNLGAALRDLHRREGDLFGCAAGEESSAQSRVLLSAELERLTTTPSNQLLAPRTASDRVDGIGYLMGQGLRERDALNPTSIRVKVLFRTGTSIDQREEVERALMVLGLLGGLGSRARRGFGSLALEAIEDDTRLDFKVPTKVATYQQVLADLISIAATTPPPFSAFAAASRIDLSVSGKSANSVLASVGKNMREARQNLENDNTWARLAADNKQPTQPPERSIFGLPLGFYFNKDGAKVLVEPNTQQSQKMDRRASPLLIHIHAFPDEIEEQRFAAVQTFLPAQFLPRDIGIRVKRIKGEGSFPFPNYLATNNPITDYLDSFSSYTTVVLP